MKNIIFIMIIFSLHLFAQTKTYTLEESIKLGIENSKSLNMSNAKLAIASAKVNEVKSQRFPKLSFNASYMRLSDVPPFEISISFFPTPITIQEPILNSYNFKFSLQQPIFTGFKLTALHSAANYNLESTKLDYSKELNEEVFNIISAFWNIYKAQYANKLIDENLRSLESHISDAKSFLQNDLITKNDLLKIELQYSTIQLKKIEIENSLKMAKAIFNKIVGNNLAEEFEISREELTTENTNMDFNELIKRAKSTRFELESISNKIMAGKEQLSASKSGWYPSIYLISDFYYSRPNQRIFPQKDQFDDTWDVGIALSWDIWNWGYNSSQSDQAENNLLQLETSKSQLEDAIEIEVYNSFLTFQAAKKKVDLSRQSLEQANENYRITNEKYLVQLVSATELLDAETAFYNSKTELLNSLVDYEIVKTKLDKIVGKKLY